MHENQRPLGLWFTHHKRPNTRTTAHQRNLSAEIQEPRLWKADDNDSAENGIDMRIDTMLSTYVFSWKSVILILMIITFLPADGSYKEREKWILKAEKMLAAKVKRNSGKLLPAKNVIMFIGDGMSMATITAARILKGQNRNESGLETVMAYEEFPFTGISKTSNTDRQVPDSAGTATAFFCGIKTKHGVVGVDDQAVRGNCTSLHGAEVECLASLFLRGGKDVGIVTNSRITHATPSPLYAKSVDRDWEHDGKLPAGAEPLCQDIAMQLVHKQPGRDIKVLMGGGRANFLPNTQKDPEYGGKVGNRKDGRDLIADWINDKRNRSLKHTFVWNAHQLNQVDPQNTEYLIGLFEPDHMQDVTIRDAIVDQDPSLPLMTRKAIEILSRSNNGFFLAVENGLIDKRHHDSLAYRAIHEAVQLDEAVEVAVKHTDAEETLIVVTSDHSHGLAFVGDGPTGSSVFDKAKEPAGDKLPFTKLLYAAGKGYKAPRENITNVDTENKDYMNQAAVPRRSVTHSAEDVPVYATGPMAFLFTGAYDQHVLAHAVAQAACVDQKQVLCRSQINGAQRSVKFHIDRIIVAMLFTVITHAYRRTVCL